MTYMYISYIHYLYVYLCAYVARRGHVVVVIVVGGGADEVVADVPVAQAVVGLNLEE